MLPRLVTARAFSILGDNISQVTIPLAIIVAHRPAWLAGVITASLFLPASLFGVHIGSFADRYSRRRLIMAADAGRVVIYLGLGPLLWITPSAPADAGVIVLAFAAGTLDALFNSAFAGFVAHSVPATALVRSNSYLEAGDAGASLAGPALGGVILQKLNIIGALAVNALSFAISMAIFFTCPVDEDDSAPEASPQAREGKLAGFGEIMHRPQQRLLQVAYVYMHFFAGVVGLAVTFYAVRTLGFDATRTGLLLAGSGVGGLVASLGVARLVERWRWGLSIGASILLGAVGLGLLLAAHGFIMAVVAVAILDCGSASCFILATSARQAVTPLTLMGRVSSSSAMLTATVRALAAASFGFLLSAFGARTMIWVLLVITIPAGLWLVTVRAGRQVIGAAANDDELATSIG